MYKFIKIWSDFILNETLKTNDIDFVIKNVSSELNLSHIRNDMYKYNNKIEMIIYDFDELYNLDIIFDYINSLMIDRNGWFPSKYILYNISDMKNEFLYDEDFLKQNQRISKLEAKALIESIFYKAMKQKIKFSDKELETFSNASKLIELNSRPINVLSVILLTILHKRNK